MNIVNLMDMKKGKRKASLILWAASLAFLMQVQPLCAMDQPETREQKLANARAKKQEMLRKIGEASQPQLEKAPEQKAQAKKEPEKSAQEQKVQVKSESEQKAQVKREKLKVGKEELPNEKPVKTGKAPLKIGGKKTKLNYFEETLKKEVGDPSERQEIESGWNNKRQETYSEKLDKIEKNLTLYFGGYESAPFYGELQNFILIVKGVKNAHVSFNVREPLVKKLLQKISETLNSGEANFIQSLYREMHKIIVQQEAKYRSENPKKYTKEEVEKNKENKERLLKEMLPSLFSAFLLDPEAAEKMGVPVEEIKKLSYGDRLRQIVLILFGVEEHSPGEFLEILKQYRYMLESVIFAEVSPEVRQALAKTLFEKARETLTKIELLDGIMKPLIVKEENKYKIENLSREEKIENAKIKKQEMLSKIETTKKGNK